MLRRWKERGARGKRRGKGEGQRKRGRGKGVENVDSRETSVFHDVHVHSKSLVCTQANLKQV